MASHDVINIQMALDTKNGLHAKRQQNVIVYYIHVRKGNQWPVRSLQNALFHRIPLARFCIDSYAEIVIIRPALWEIVAELFTSKKQGNGCTNRSRGYFMRPGASCETASCERAATRGSIMEAGAATRGCFMPAGAAFSFSLPTFQSIKLAELLCQVSERLQRYFMSLGRG